MKYDELVTVSAYTGVLLCDLDDLYRKSSEAYGRPLMTHEYADRSVQAAIRKALLPEVRNICDRARQEKGR